MSGRSRSRIPWLLVAGSGVLAVLLAYVLFAGYIPTRRHVDRLDAELKEVYAREAALQSRVADLEERLAERDREIAALRAERRADPIPPPPPPGRR